MTNRRRRTGGFWAVDDDGKRHYIIIYTQDTDATTLGGSGQDELPGVLEYVTSNGLRVSRLEKGKYQVVQTGTILRSDAEDAL
jgi:hypothetical protein